MIEFAIFSFIFPIKIGVFLVTSSSFPTRQSPKKSEICVHFQQRYSKLILISPHMCLRLIIFTKISKEKKSLKKIHQWDSQLFFFFLGSSMFFPIRNISAFRIVISFTSLKTRMTSMNIFSDLCMLYHIINIIKLSHWSAKRMQKEICQLRKQKIIEYLCRKTKKRQRKKLSSNVENMAEDYFPNINCVFVY